MGLVFVYKRGMVMIERRDIGVNGKEFSVAGWNVILSIRVRWIVGIVGLGGGVEGYFKIGMKWLWRMFLGVGG